MKVMIIQEEGPARDQLEEFLQAGGAEVVTVRPSWPRFYFVAKEEKPDVAVVDCSPDPGYGRECAGYLGETGFTNRIKVLAVNVPVTEEDRLKTRAPKAKIVSLNDLVPELQQIDPEFDPTAPRAAEEED